ncbi:hypothetical protein RLOC_00004791 [Lonchura striata]|uniref:Uncharacterized protein n=1 Tax=Lonchura striata TaxID=40157 RepID=A0A218UFC0_9PASE|nr:hypothetical protein RLOC_00004791 [Lonchura striata domestica]
MGATAVVRRGMDHRHAAAINRNGGAPPPGRSLPCPGGSVRTGHSSVRATKYSWNAPPGPTGLPPRTPLTLLGWSPPHARFQETAPDAGSRVEPHWAKGRLRQGGTTGQRAGRVAGSARTGRSGSLCCWGCSVLPSLSKRQIASSALPWPSASA